MYIEPLLILIKPIRLKDRSLIKCTTGEPNQYIEEVKSHLGFLNDINHFNFLFAL